MRRLVPAFLIAPLLVWAGCSNMSDSIDRTPPDPPVRLTTQAGDGFVDLQWSPNREPDLAGYNVFVSTSYDGRYELIGSTVDPHFVDYGARNGDTYYYAVTAFDYEGNESALSSDVAYDVPRPEGYDVILSAYRESPRQAGFDLSVQSVVPFDDQSSDMYYDYSGGVGSMNVSTDTDIQDMGPTASLSDIRIAPAGGWSPDHSVTLHPGHTYIVWTWDDHYAKFRVTALSSGRVVFDWAYQLQRANPLMKRAATPPTTRHASLVTERG